MLGHHLQGSGPRAVIVLNDWLCDTSTWDEARPYLTDPALTWAFVDLRGYGRSRDLRGELTLEEAARDVLALADARRWKTFSIVGHSMSSLIALLLAQTSVRVERTVLVTPPPPAGFGYDDATLEAVRAVGRGDDAVRERALRRMLGDLVSEGWLRAKLRRWRERSDPESVARWVALFGRQGVPDPAAPVAAPLLAVTGELDAEVMRREATTRALAPLCAQLTVTPFAECGHYPMQEAPPRFAAVVERFLAS